MNIDADEKKLLLAALTFYEAWVEHDHAVAERVRSKLAATLTSKPEPAPQPGSAEDKLRGCNLTLNDMLPIIEEFRDEMFNGK